jgi:hypothetical protein
MIATVRELKKKRKDRFALLENPLNFEIECTWAFKYKSK